MKDTARCFTARVQATDLGASEQEDPLASLLLNHVTECAECLSALCADDSLSESGCAEYERLSASVRAEAAPIKQEFDRQHVSEETLEEHCFGRLPLADTWALKEHIQSCANCEARLAVCRDLIQLLKKSLAQWRHRESEDSNWSRNPFPLHDDYTPESPDPSPALLFRSARAGECRV
ncbi:MAG: hypothetical protein ACRD19_04395 [Terriglobia bacterium]